MKIKNVMLTVLAVFIILPAMSQLRAPFRSESAGVRYVQLPYSEKQYRNLTVQTTQKATLGENVARTTERASGALSRIGVDVEDETGTLTDKSAPERTYQLIPDIFPAEGGDLFLEVLFYDEDRIVAGDIPNRFYDGAEYEVKVSYNLYEMPERNLIESGGPFWVAGKGSSSAGPLQTREQKYNDRLRIAQGWATQKIRNKYSLKYGYLPVNVYTIRGLSGDAGDLQNEAQEKFIPLANRFRTRHNEDSYKAEVEECIKIWENLLQKYVPGGGRRDADINDNNVFTLYYNLALANYLIGNKAEAEKYAKKGMAATRIEWQEITNRNDEVIGRSRSGVVHATEDIFHNLKESMDAYYAGIDFHNPVFVDMLIHADNMMLVSNAARHTAVNMYLSQTLGIDFPIDIVTSDFNENPKHISGSISKNGSVIANYEIKKNFLSFINTKYNVTVSNNDNSVIAKQQLYETMLPNTNYDFVLLTGRNSFIGLPDRIMPGKLKTKPNRSKMMPIYIMYDYDANVYFTKNKIQDRWWYLRNFSLFGVVACERDALRTYRNFSKANLDNYETISTIESEITNIERDRDRGFMAYINAIFDKDGIYGTMKYTLISSETRDKRVDIQNKRAVKSSDSNGNWTKLRMGDIELERTITY